MGKTKRRRNKVVAVRVKKQPKSRNSTSGKFPLSTIGKGIAHAFGIDALDGVIESGAGWLGRATGLPIGVQTGTRLGGRTASSLISAPATVGTVSRTPNWDFNRAPDLGNGPGIRISGRQLIGYVNEGFASGALPPFGPYIGVAPQPAPTGTAPLQNFIFSPVAAFTADDTNCPFGAYGSSDSILQKVSECWTRWRLVDCTVEYQPAIGTQNNKQISIAWVPDPEVIAGNLNASVGGTGNSLEILPFSNNDVVLDIPNCVTTPAWAPATFILPCDNKSKELLYVNSEDFDYPFIKVGDISSEMRFLFPGGFMVTGAGPTCTSGPTCQNLGALFANLTVDLYQLALNAVPLFVNANPDVTRDVVPGSKQFRPYKPKRIRQKPHETGERQATEMKTGHFAQAREVPDIEECHKVMDCSDDFVSVPGSQNLKKRKLLPTK